jgi:hypothetical protein
VGTLVQDVQMEITHLNEIDWFVGKRKEEKITQSITFYVNMPKVQEDDLRYLMEEKGIDAWIVRLIMVRAGKTQDLGSLYTLFQPVSRGRRSTVAAGPATSVTIKIYYAAAYASERFRAFRCPAFEHNKKISSMQINGEDTPFEISIQGGVPYLEKSQLIELTPSSFNGGHTLIGEYFLEIAPYSSKNKQIFSGFKRLPMWVQVKEEESVSIPSCAGIHPELQP